MAKEYLEELHLGDEVRSKLDALGDPTLFDLVARAKAAPKEFADYLGQPDGAERAIQELESHLSHAERQLLSAAPKKFALGANLGPAPKINPSSAKE
jgi:hypothetical protein